MATTPSADDGSTPMEVEVVQNEDHTVHRLFIRGYAVKETSKEKVKRYIDGLSMGLQLGEVTISERIDLGALQVEFDCSKAKKCVKNITLEIDGEESCPASSTASRPQDIQPKISWERLDQPIQGLQSTMRSANLGDGTLGWSRTTETGSPEACRSPAYGQNLNGQPRSPVIAKTSSPCKLTMFTAVQLDLDSLVPALRGKVLDLIRVSNFNCRIPMNGKVIFEGLFEDVATFYEEVNALLNNIPDKVNANQEASAPKDCLAAEMQSHDREQSIAAEQDANQLRLSFFHYDYLNKVWADQIRTFQQHYRVDLLTQVVLKIQAKEQQDQSKVKEALEALTKLIQPLLTDLGWVKVTVPDSDRPNLPKTVRDMQTRKHSCYLTELEEGFAITGPKSHLEQVKDEMMKLLKSTSSQRATLKIESEKTAGMTELKMTMFHWELLKNNFKDELKSICNKYQVKIEPDVKSNKEDVRILVKSQNAGQDLSANALQQFILLYQKAVTSCITQAVGSDHSICVKQLFDEMRLNKPGVQLLQADGGGLCLLGLPQHVKLAVQDLEQCLGRNVFIPQAHQFNGIISLSATSVSLKGNTEGAKGTESEENICSICLCSFTDKMTTECNHSFCKECWNQAMAVTPQCPICKKTYGMVIGNQPDGDMKVYFSPMSLPGFEGNGMICIHYNFPNGIQTDKHPHPGRPYFGSNRKAYLPDSAEGYKVLNLLKKAFDQKLIFTIGDSRTTGMKDVLTWNDIHHKTNTHGGPTQFGFPDPDYLKRVRQELRAKGIE